MFNLEQSAWFWLLAFAAAAAVFWPKFGLIAQAKRRQEIRRRAELEDALKHILTWDNRGQQATTESLGGTLGLSPGRVVRLISRMQTRGLVRSEAGALHLTSEGTRWAVHVVRAHRLWERYLADDAGMPMSRLHQAAEKAEHLLSEERLEQLDADLGHPRQDPHGDPIPSAAGSVTEANAVPLTDWPLDQPARIVHIEDEPDAVFQQILAEGLRPRMNLRVIEKTPTRIVASSGDEVHELAHVVAANVHVAEAIRESARSRGLRKLSELDDGERAEVAELDPLCAGFGRRRLLDLGMTPGARVETALANPFRDPRGYLVRGTVIALRRQQAEQIWVRPVAKAGESEGAEMEAVAR